ncbi:hypothetical protein H4R20_003406, partial [Coemansia guatemalensis]
MDTVRPLRERTQGIDAHSAATAAEAETAAAPIVGAAALATTRSLSNNNLVYAPDTEEPAEPQLRVSMSYTHGNSRAKEVNLPFTYSGVFSDHMWREARVTTDAASTHAECSAEPPTSSGAPAGGGGDSAQTYDSSLVMHGGVSAGSVAHSHMPSGLHTARFPVDYESDSSTDGDDDDDDGSESESYEGLAVDDINETYDHKLPEFVPNPDPLVQRIYFDEEGITVDVCGMSYSLIGLGLYRILGVVTLGIMPLVCRWVPRWRVWWTMHPEHLGDATFVVITDEFGAVSSQVIKRRSYGGTLESIFGSLTRKGPLYKHNDDI